MGILFAQGRGPVGKDWKKNYQEMSTLGKAYAEGWSNGCPIPTFVILLMGADRALARYQDVNETFEEATLLLSCAGGVASLASELRTHIKREKDEKGYLLHEANNVPETHLDYIGPLGENYALPRMMISIREKAKYHGRKTQDHQFEVLLEAARHSQNRLELAARVGEQAVKEGVHPNEVLHQLLSNGNKREQRNYRRYDQLFGIMQEVAPTLVQANWELTRDQKSGLDVVHFRKVRNPDTGNARYTCRPD